MEQTIASLQRRQSRQMRLEEALKFGILEANRRHSVQRDSRKITVLPPISKSKESIYHVINNNTGGNRRLRAKSIAVMRLPMQEQSYGLVINGDRPIKLPKILPDRKLSITNDDGHWHLPARRVSRQNNKLIVDHLRNKLLRQHERRSVAYEDEMKALKEDDGGSVATRESFDEDTIRWIQSVRSRGPSLSTMNFSSTATSRMDNFADISCESVRSLSRRQSNVSIESFTTSQHNIGDASTSDVMTDRRTSFPPPLISRPSICVSSETGFTDWISVDDESKKNDKENRKTPDDVNNENDVFCMTSQLQRSMSESERSVNLLIQKARRRSILSEIPESDQENRSMTQQRSGSKSPLSSRLVASSVVLEDVGKQTWFARSKTPDPDRVDTDLPIGDVSLFADWKTVAGSPDRSRSGSFMSDHMTLNDDVTNNALSRHNSFITESRPSTACASPSVDPVTAEQGEDDKIVNENRTSVDDDVIFDEICNVDDVTLSARQEVLNKVCLGDVTVPTTQLKRKVIVYFSSSGLDTNLERGFLIDTMTSRLRHFCGERGLSFDLIDLELLPSEHKISPLEADQGRFLVDNGHSMAQLKSSLIRKCFNESLGPCFMSFLGDTLGRDPPLPGQLPVTVFDVIIKMIDDEVNEYEMQILQLNSATAESGRQDDSTTALEEKRSVGSSEGNSSHYSDIVKSSKSTKKSKSTSYAGSTSSGVSSSCSKEASRIEGLITSLKEKIRRLKNQENLLRKWYLLDTNSCPPLYRLRSIRDEFKSYASVSTSTSNAEMEKRRRERQYWLHVESRLWRILVTFTKTDDCYSPEADFTSRWTQHAFKTSIDAESSLVNSISYARAGESCFWFHRSILNYDLEDEETRSFISMKPMTTEIDAKVSENVRKLGVKLTEKFGYSNIREYPLPWKPVQQAYRSRDEIIRAWTMYLERFRLDFYNVCTMQIDNAVSKAKIEKNDNFLDEIHEHVKFSQKLSESFVGRLEILNSIKAYLRSSKNRKPLLLCGPAGSGKSSIMSKASMMARTWMRSKVQRIDVTTQQTPTRCTVLFRSVGATGDSFRPRCLLSSLVAQLRHIVDEMDDENSTEDGDKEQKHRQHKMRSENLDFRDLAIKFSNLLGKCATRNSPLLVFLDNLDALQDDNDARKFKWIPEKLPKYVELVVSVSRNYSTELESNKKTSRLGRKRSISRIGKLPSSANLHKNSDSNVSFESDCFEVLKSRYGIEDGGYKRASNLVTISPLATTCRSASNSLALPSEQNETSLSDVLQKLLESEKRNLTSDQTQLIASKCRLCPHPLTAELCAWLSRDWTSSTPVEDCAISLPQNADNVEGFVHCCFRKLEETHGRPLTAVVACFLTSSFNGLTSPELKSLLSFDKSVSKWISELLARSTPPGGGKARANQQKSPQKMMKTRANVGGSKQGSKSQNPAKNSKAAELVAISRVPDVLLLRLLEDLKFSLQESLSDHLLTMRWRHGIFAKVAATRYLSSKEIRKYYHHLMACYFSDKIPTDSPDKPLPTPHAHNERHDDVCQPLSWENAQTRKTDAKSSKTSKSHTSNSSGDEELLSLPIDPVYNLRRLSESPHHFLQSRTLEELKDEIFCNYEWMLAKIRGTSYEALMETMTSVMEVYSSDNDLRLLAEALYLSRVILKEDPRQLGAQIVGRLHAILKKDKPLARMDPRKYPFCRQLVAQCRRTVIPALIPSGTCLESPGDVLFDLQLGHRDVINAVTMTTDGQRAVTSSKDETIKVWDLFSGRVVSTLEEMPRHVTSLTLCMGNNYVAMIDRDNKVEVTCLRTCSSILSLNEASGHVIMAVAGEGQTLLLIYNDASKMLKVWDLDKERFLNQIDITPDGVHLRTDQWLIAGKNSRGNNVLCSFHSSDQAYVYNVKRSKLLQTLKLQHDIGFALITHVEVSREYYVIACTRQYMKLHEMVTFELYDAINYGHVRTIKGCPEDKVFDIFINRLGSHLIGLCKGATGTEVGVWNVESGNHQHMACQKFHSNQGCCVDLQYCITSGEAETTLRVHNLAARIDDRTMSKTQVKKKALGIGEFYPVTSNSRYVVARGMENGPITVWNITRGRCKGEAVSIERGLLEKNDVVVVKDVTVIVLSDRGISSVDEGSKQVFKTIYIYDLRTKKYTKKLHPVAVTTCPRHEYRILGLDRLLGVSHDRNYFVTWSLITGEVLSKIFPDFSKYEIAEIAAKENKEKRWKRRRDKSRVKLSTKNLSKSSGSSFHLSADERNKLIDESLMSDDESTMLCSFYGRHVAVFDMEKQVHTHTLTNKHSMLLLHQAQITSRGCHLVHTNYDDDAKLSYLTVWSLQQGCVLRRLRNEPLVCALAVSENASRVVFATEDNCLKIWEPFKKGYHRKITGYNGLRMRKRSNGCQGTTVHLMSSAKRAILFTYDVSLWDLECGYVLARFTPDVPFHCGTVAMNGNLIVVGMTNTPSVVTLRLMSRDCNVQDYGRATLGREKGMFGEVEERDSESSEDEMSEEFEN